MPTSASLRRSCSFATTPSGSVKTIAISDAEPTIGDAEPSPRWISCPRSGNRRSLPAQVPKQIDNRPVQKRNRPRRCGRRDGVRSVGASATVPVVTIAPIARILAA